FVPRHPRETDTRSACSSQTYSGRPRQQRHMRTLTWRHWLHGVGERALPLRRRPSSTKLRLEPLEGRIAPATLRVNTLFDTTPPGDGLVSLREAVLAHAAAAPSLPVATDLGDLADGIDTIVFDPTLPAGGPRTVTLTTGQLPLTGPLTIDGPGATLLSISGNLASRIFDIGAGADVNISGLTLTQGKVTNQNGGAIRNVAGTL